MARGRVHIAFYIGSLTDMGTGPALWLAEAAGFLLLSLAVFLVFPRRLREPVGLER